LITRATTLRELAFFVCSALDAAKSIAVLSGGGAASVYAPEAYQSRDLDFILQFGGSVSAEPLEKLGFSARGGTYAHPDTEFTVEFPAGPLAWVMI
jgi:ribulose 1,5-bisphosphate carboxylase large subunit-like protein